MLRRSAEEREDHSRVLINGGVERDPSARYDLIAHTHAHSHRSFIEKLNGKVSMSGPSGAVMCHEIKTHTRSHHLFLFS